jgi:hypothetical protein
MVNKVGTHQGVFDLAAGIGTVGGSAAGNGSVNGTLRGEAGLQPAHASRRRPIASSAVTVFDAASWAAHITGSAGDRHRYVYCGLLISPL